MNMNAKSSVDVPEEMKKNAEKMTALSEAFKEMLKDKYGVTSCCIMYCINEDKKEDGICHMGLVVQGDSYELAHMLKVFMDDNPEPFNLMALMGIQEMKETLLAEKTVKFEDN